MQITAPEAQPQAEAEAWEQGLAFHNVRLPYLHFLHV